MHVVFHLEIQCFLAGLNDISAETAELVHAHDGVVVITRHSFWWEYYVRTLMR